MTRVLVLGGSGMLGSMVTDVLSRDSELSVRATVRDESSLESGRRAIPDVDWRLFDAESDDFDALERVDWVVNAIGITKPLIHDDNAVECRRAIRVNSMFPHHLSVKAQEREIRVVQIATDCVFSGLKGQYGERDLHDALDVYGKTKSLGEVPLKNMQHLRCSIIGPEPRGFKFLLEWFRRQPENARVTGYTNHRWNGVTTLHFARIAHGMIKSDSPAAALQHVVPTGELTKAEMLRVFAKSYGRSDVTIQDSEASTIVDRTLRTEQGDFNRLLWSNAGYETPPTVAEMIQEISQFDFRCVERSSGTGSAS